MILINKTKVLYIKTVDKRKSEYHEVKKDKVFDSDYTYSINDFIKKYGYKYIIEDNRVYVKCSAAIVFEDGSITIHFSNKEKMEKFINDYHQSISNEFIYDQED